MSYRVLSEDNHKTVKGRAAGYMTLILHLAPGALSGHQVCPKASEGCLAACLNTAGLGQLAGVQKARIAKTQRLFADRSAFLQDLEWDIRVGQRRATRQGLKLAVRLNGTSDLPWENFRFGEYRNLMEAFPDVQFYDYTKIVQRALDRTLPSNYHLTFSRSETNDVQALRVLEAGVNVAMVFRQLPRQIAGHKVIDGDANDLRFLDARNVVVGLKTKGKAKQDTSGFVL